MAFEKVSNKNYAGKNTLDGYSISYRRNSKDGKYLACQISFGGGMDRLFRGYKNIRTFSDKDKQLVAVQPNNDPRDDFNRALRKNGNRYFMTSNTFIRLMVEDYDYMTSTKLGYEVLDNKLIVLKNSPLTNKGER